jgi:phage/plasmid-like protein (TIGR03299 family)
MSHDLCVTDGKAEMMYVGEMPWHGLGTRLEHPPRTAAEAIFAARLDWNVVKQQLYVGDKHRPLPGQFAIVREDRWERNEDAIFGTVGQTYVPLQNMEAFTFFDPIIATKAAFYETAGALGKGERVWVMARLYGDMEIVPGDTVARYLLLSNSHDGTSSVQVKFTPVRVVCQNTLNQALDLGPTLRVAHNREMQRHLGDTAEAIAEICERFDELQTFFKKMVWVQMKTASLETYLAAVFPEPKRGKDDKRYERALKQMKRDRISAQKLFETGKGNDLPLVKGTLWAAYNGVTEYVDFARTTVGDGKWLDSVWFGEGCAIKTRACDLAVAAVNEVHAGLN